MLDHYSHIRLDAKRAALEALSSRGWGVVTSQGTSQTRRQSHLPIRKLLRELVDGMGFEPTASSLRTRYKIQ